MIAAWILIALCAGQVVLADVSPFTIDREYKYQYTSQGNNAFSYHLNGKLVVQNQGQYVYFKFKPDQESMGYHAFEAQHQKEAQQLNQQASQSTYTKQQMYDYLVKPVRVTYLKGVVKSFEAYTDDITYSVNIKKAILSMFQMNFERVNQISFQKSNYVVPKEERANFYRVMENGIGGECETVYEIVSPNPYNHHGSHQGHNHEAAAQSGDYNTLPTYLEQHGNRVFNVSKHRLYDRCHNRPQYYYSSMTGWKSAMSETASAWKTTSSAEYEVYGTRAHYTINHIYQQNTFTYAPFTTNGKYYETNITQNMHLVDQDTISEAMTFPSTFTTYNSLSYNYTYEQHDHNNAENFETNTPYYHERNMEVNYQNAQHEVAQLLTAFSAEYDYKTYADNRETGKYLPERFSLLTNIFATFTYDQLAQTYNQHCNFDAKTATQQQRYMQSMFHDALAVTGTGPAVKFIMHLIESGAVRGNCAAELVQEVPSHLKEPSAKLIEEFYTFTKGPEVRAHRQLHSAAYLAFGSMINFACKRNAHHPFTAQSNFYLDHERCTQYAKDIYKLFEVTENEYEQLLYIKVIANMEISEIFPYIRQIVENRNGQYPISVRLAAVYGIFEYMHEVREQVYATFLPLFNNRSEATEMRVYAFEVMMYSEPSYDLLHQMGQQLFTEEDTEVASYVHSTYQGLMNTTEPDFLKTAKDVKLVYDALNMNQLHYGNGHSRMNMYSYSNAQYNYGGSVYAAYIASKHSPLPSALYFAKTARMLNYNFNIFQVYFRSRGMNKYAERFLGPNGLFNPSDNRKSALNAFTDKAAAQQNNAGNANTHPDVTKYSQQQHFQARQNEQPEAQLCFYWMGKEVRYFSFDKDDFRQMFTSGMAQLNKDLPKYFQNGHKINYRRAHQMAEWVYELPTDAGYPIRYQFKVPAFVYAQGQFQMDFQPGFFGQERNYNKPTQFQLNTSLQFGYDAQAVFSVSLLTPQGQHYGQGMKTDLTMKMPFNGQATYDFAEKKFQLNYKPTDTQYEFMHYNATPFRYVQSGASYKVMSESKGFYAMEDEQNQQTHSYSLGQDYFGFGYQFTHTYEYYYNTLGHYYNFFRNFFYSQFTGQSGQYQTQYYDVFTRFRAAYYNMADYFFFQPNGRSYEAGLTYQPAQSNPTTEVEYTVDFDYSRAFYYQNQKQNEQEYTHTYNPTNQPQRYYSVSQKLQMNGQSPRQFQTFFNVTYNPFNYQVYKTSFNYQRNAIANYDVEPFKFCYKSNWVYPEMPTPYYNVDYTKEHKMEYTANVEYGKNCDNDKKITVQATFEKTQEQKQWERNQKYYTAKFNPATAQKMYTQEYDNYMQWMRQYYTYNRINANIEYRNMDERSQRCLNHLSHYTQYLFAPNTEVSNFGINNPENKMTLRAEFNQSHPTVTVTVNKPKENVVYNQVYYPAYWPYYFPNSAQDSLRSYYQREINNYTLRPVCRIQYEVDTFDNNNYTFPQNSNCYHVAMQDCSQRQAFSVLVRNNPQNNKKSVKVYVENNMVEMSAEADQVTVKVNGQPKTLSLGQKFVQNCQAQAQQENTPYQSSEPCFIVYQYSDKYYKIHSPRYGFSAALRYNGKNVQIYNSAWNRGRTCGLCGEYNGVSQPEYVGPNQCQYQNTTNFVNSYALADENCAAPQYQQECEHYNYETRQDDCMVKRNRVVYRADGKSKMSRRMCFSVQALPECRDGCTPINTVKAVHAFHCVDASDKSATYMRESARYRELHEIQNQPESYYTQIEYPTDCVSY